MKAISRTIYTITSILILEAVSFAADPVTVNVNIDMNHKVGEIDSFHREKFVTIHANVGEMEWDGDNFVDDLRADFLEKYDVYMGRDTGGITWRLNYNCKEDPKRPGFVDPVSLKAACAETKFSYISNPKFHKYEKRNNQVLCAQLHPFWPDGKKTQYTKWSLSQKDTKDEPLGTASGEYMGIYIRDAYGKGGTDGPPRPKWVEIINEPVWHLVDYGNTPIEKIFKYHNTVARQIKKYNPDMPVGGYCTAFPDLEKRDFAQWHERWKLFIDMCGNDMDFWTVHIYDFPCFNNGQILYRKGSQMEATFDMIEHYSQIKLGHQKPFLISEGGSQMHDLNKVWSPYRDWLHMRSYASQMMQFMDRPHLINIFLNFLIVKAEWGKQGDVVYGHRLMRKEDEPGSYTGKWVYTPNVLLYEQWANVKGKRVESKSSDLDVLVDSYVEGNKVYVILNNLLFERVVVNLNVPGVTPGNFAGGMMKNLFLDGEEPYLKKKKLKKPLVKVKLEAEATIILEYELNAPVKIDQSCEEIKYYADTYLQPIKAGQSSTFKLNGVKKGENGEAVLRIGIGRAHGRDLFPEVKINGKKLSLPPDYKGDDQKDRASFFGVLEIDVPWSELKDDNTVTVKFDDEGGYVSSMSMQVYNHSRSVARGF